MKDIATCLYCNKDFTVTEYGYRVKCPLCGNNLDIFPDDKYYVDSPWGMIGIAVSEKKSIAGGILSKLICRIKSRKIFLKKLHETK